MIKAINNNIVVSPIETVRRGMIYLPQDQQQKCFYGIVRSVGDEVKNKSISKDTIVCCEHSGRTQRGNEYVFKEEHILMIRYKNIWRPVGRKLLVKRLTEEIKHEAGFIIPSCYKSSDQSLHCLFIANGLVDNEVYNNGFDLIAGDVIRLVDWNKEITEIEIDGGYYLIVKPSHILYTTYGDSDMANRIIN